MSNHHVLWRTLALAVLVTAVGACAGGAGSPTSPAGGGTAPAAAGTGTSGGGGGGAGAPAPGCSTPIDGSGVGAPYASIVAAAICGMDNLQPCSLLNQADVQALFSVPLASTKTDGLGECTWPLSDPDKGEGLSISINVGQGDGPLKDDMGTDDTPIRGIGDSASWNLVGGYFPHLGAVKGQDTCELLIGGGNAQLSVPTTGKGVFAAIDPAALPGFMQQLGALCNTIFASIGA
jgi:hypothetical protein